MGSRGETGEKEVWKDGGRPNYLEMLPPEIDSLVRRRAKEVWDGGGLEVQRRPTGADDELRKPMPLNGDPKVAALL
eukprot:4028404-Pyramimonas_sp.AAC.1